LAESLPRRANAARQRHGAKEPLKSLEFATLRIKDAVCDRFRDAGGRRPDVERSNPDVRVHAFLEGARGTLYLDTSGEPLFKRGWRAGQAEAPLRENLAAGIVMLSGWRPGEPLLDPMCGGATLLVEAAAMARGRAPGARRAFGFEKLAVFDPALWEKLKREAQASSESDLRLYGSDTDPRALAAARRNLAAAGVRALGATGASRCPGAKRAGARRSDAHESAVRRAHGKRRGAGGLLPQAG